MPSPARVIADSDLLLVPVAARSKGDRRSERSGRDRATSQPQGGHPQKPIGQGLPVFTAEIWRSQIWPSLTLPVRPVGRVCARLRFRPNTCVFGQTLGRCWNTGSWNWDGVPVVRAEGPRPCGPRREAEYKAAETRSNASILLTDWYSFVWWSSL